MRGRTRVIHTLVASVAAVALSAPASAAGGQPGRTLEWGLTDCRGVVALIPVDRATLQPHLPAGFSPTLPPSVAALLPPDPRLEAVLGLEVFDCVQGEGLHGPVEGLDYASFWTFVEPPAHLADHGKQLTFFKWDTLVPDEPRRELLREYGVPARDGHVALDLWSDEVVPSTGSGAPAVALDAGWSFDGGERYTFTGVATAPVEFAGSFVEYGHAGTGLAKWATDYRSLRALGGAGAVTLDPAGFPAQALGRTVTDAYFLVLTGLDFVDGQITLPPRRCASHADDTGGGACPCG
ncbi:MAG: hypothetical protein WD794_16065 [Mycobacteriales bacterium]